MELDYEGSAVKHRVIFPAELADVFLERGELPLDEIDGGLVLELELVVELVLRQADEHLRPRHYMRIEVFSSSIFDFLLTIVKFFC
jgi:hypothetical protein